MLPMQLLMCRCTVIRILMLSRLLSMPQQYLGFCLFMLEIIPCLTQSLWIFLDIPRSLDLPITLLQVTRCHCSCNDILCDFWELKEQCWRLCECFSKMQWSYLIFDICLGENYWWSIVSVRLRGCTCIKWIFLWKCIMKGYSLCKWLSLLFYKSFIIGDS